DGNDDRLAHEFVLRSGRVHSPREQVGPASSSGRHHEFDWLRWLPVGQGGRCGHQGNGEGKVCEFFHAIFSLERYAPVAGAWKRIPTRSPWRAASLVPKPQPDCRTPSQPSFWRVPSWLPA